MRLENVLDTLLNPIFEIVWEWVSNYIWIGKVLIRNEYKC